MPRERKPQHKPLSFSTTMRNPVRIAAFLNSVLPYEGQLLTNEIVEKVAISLIVNKLYKPVYVSKKETLNEKYRSDELFTVDEATEIMINSPQDHKEAGFEKGWQSRFDTWYKLSMEFGFIYYEMNAPVIISTTGHMLVDSLNEIPKNDEKIQSVFLNSMMKYQTNNPFRKNANSNAPLPLLLKVIKLLKEDKEENDAGIFRKELSLFICWANNNAEELYKKIKEVRKTYKYNYSDEVMYEICLDLLGATNAQRNRFKLDQITAEAVDEFIRKMRITGIFSLRGNGRFLDTNSFESDKIAYILENYVDYDTFASKKDFFNYMGAIDTNIVSITTKVIPNLSDIRQQTLLKWANDYTKEAIFNELSILTGKTGSKNDTLKIIDAPTRLEFLTSISLVQNFENIVVNPNYHVDDEGLPTFTASGGIADIECLDDECNSLFEVTLMTAKNQATNELPAITRHLQDAIKANPNKTVFSALVAPRIHQDSIYMANFTKYQYGIDILTLTIDDFVKQIQICDQVIDMINVS